MSTEFARLKGKGGLLELCWKEREVESKIEKSRANKRTSNWQTPKQTAQQKCKRENITPKKDNGMPLTYQGN